MVLNQILGEVDAYIRNSEKKLNEIKKDFIPQLTGDLEKHADQLKHELMDKQKFLSKYTSAISAIKKLH